MSAGTLRVDEIQSPDNLLVFTKPYHPPGYIVQTKYSRTDSQNAYSAPAALVGTVISPLSIGITPKYSNSKIIIEWMIHGEIVYDAGFLIYQDGQPITTSSYEGQNSTNLTSTKYLYNVAKYETSANNLTTPNNYYIQYNTISRGTNYRSYDIAVRATNTASTFNLNRCFNVPADSTEVGVSSVLIMEVKQ